MSLLLAAAEGLSEKTFDGRSSCLVTRVVLSTRTQRRFVIRVSTARSFLRQLGLQQGRRIAQEVIEVVSDLRPRLRMLLPPTGIKRRQIKNSWILRPSEQLPPVRRSQVLPDVVETTKTES